MNPLSFLQCLSRWANGYLLALVAVLFVGLADARANTREGITLQSTRVIYPQERKKGITVSGLATPSAVSVVNYK